MTADASLTTTNFAMALVFELVAFGLIAIAVVYGALLVWDFCGDVIRAYVTKRWYH